MCQHDHDEVLPPTMGSPSRRSVLAGAAVLAGVAAGGLGATAPASAAPVATAAAAGQRRRPARPAPVIIEGGTLIDPATGHTQRDAVVVMDGGSVVASGSRGATRAATRALRGRAVVVDASGGYVVPGLVDAHVHLSTMAAAATMLRTGATTVRSGSTSFYQDVALAAVPEWSPGAVPRMRAAGLFVSPVLGDSVLADPDLAPLTQVQGGLQDPADLAYLTKVNVSRGADVIKVRANPRAGLPEQDPTELVYDREQLAAVVKAARNRPVLCHAYSAAGIDGAVRAGVASIEHGVFVSEATIREMARRGTAFTPTLNAISDMITSPDPVLAARGRAYTPVLMAAVREAHERGVTILAGTDSYGTVGTEAALLVDSGLSRLEALRAATVNGARVLQLRQAGHLGRGAYADAVVLRANPLDDKTALQQVRTVVTQQVVLAG